MWRVVARICLAVMVAMMLFPDEVLPADANYDEARAGDYQLPDPLVAADGSQVTGATGWRGRRAELLELFSRHVYGRTPALCEIEFATVSSESALDGLATRKQIAITAKHQGRSHTFHLVLFVPTGQGAPAPVFLGVRLFDNDAQRPQPGTPLELARPLPTGIAEADLPGERLMETILRRGYAVGNIDVEEVAPDDNARYRRGIIGLYGGADEADRGADEWGALGAWAWSLSRALDYVETDAQLDAKRVAVIGHSRGGKTALWAGAQDERFALVISNNSGCGGAALSRRNYGETVRHINERFPFWFCKNFRAFNDRENALPVDQHELLALVAPRLLYVASAADDRWADPQGEWLATVAADPVFRLLGQPGLGVSEAPSVNQPLGASVGYHLRSGKHALSDYDWMQYLRFADRHWK
jgi:hypothetical protein